MRYIKWIWTYLSGARWLFFIAVILFSIESLSSIGATALQQKLIDNVLIGGSYGVFPYVVGAMAFLFVSQALLFVFGPGVSAKVVIHIRYVVAKRLMSAIYKIPIAKLQKERTATLVYYFSNDITQTGQMVGAELPRFIQHMIETIVLMIIILLVNPVILIAVTAFSLVYIGCGKYFSSRLRNMSKEVQQKKSDLLVHIEEGVSSTREVVAYGRERWETKIYNRYFKRYFDKVMEEGKLVNKQIITSDPLRWGANVVVLFYGGSLVLQGTLSIGMFVVIYQFTSRLMGTFQLDFNNAMEISKGTAHIDRIQKQMGQEKEPDGNKRINGEVHRLKFDHVDFSYEENINPVLQDVNIDFPIGKKIAIVGSSGGGKSTITQLLVRFFEPNNGRILVNQMPLGDIRRSDWMKRVSIVFQEPYLFPDTIRNNLVMGVEDISAEQIEAACRTACFYDVMMQLPEREETVIGERGITLSGGQRQRLAIARSLLQDPEILILDEATSALDMETERLMQRNLDETRKGKTTVIVAHRLSTVQNADRIYVMDQGKVAETGTHEELMGCHSIYKKLVDVQKINETKANQQLA